ncbi:MAG: TRAP transporter small permease subunit [Candidatus Rokuibacteriota bacterium]
MGQPSGTLLKTIKVIDTMSDWSGKVVALLIIPMVAGLTYEVVARYAFNAPTDWAYDLTYMLYGSHLMLGAAYTLSKGGHIRTDFFYANWSPRVQGLIDASCYLLFFFPAMIFFLLAGAEHAYYSWSVREASDASSLRPPIYPFKMVLPVTALLLLIQGVSELVKSVYAARSGKWL